MRLKRIIKFTKYANTKSIGFKFKSPMQKLISVKKCKEIRTVFKLLCRDIAKCSTPENIIPILCR